MEPVSVADPRFVVYTVTREGDVRMLCLCTTPASAADACEAYSISLFSSDHPDVEDPEVTHGDHSSAPGDGTPFICLEEVPDEEIDGGFGFAFRTMILEGEDRCPEVLRTVTYQLARGYVEEFVDEVSEAERSILDVCAVPPAPAPAPDSGAAGTEPVLGHGDGEQGGHHPVEPSQMAA